MLRGGLPPHPRRGANHDLCVLPHAKLINAFQLFTTEVQTVQTLDLAQLGEWQGEDHCIEGTLLYVPPGASKLMTICPSW